MPPEAMAGMDAPMMEAMPAEHGRYGCIWAMPPAAMGGMDADMMGNMPPEAMAGMDAP